MVETITPVVHGGSRSRYWSSLVLHALGATVAGAAFGALLGGLGALTGAPWGTAGLLVVAAVALLYLAREALQLPIPIPDRKRQVPEWWRTFYSPNVAAFLYGAGLGIGFLTYLTFGTFVAVAAGAVAAGSVGLGALVGAAFGLARAATVAVGSRAGEPGDSGALVERLGDLRDRWVVRAANAGALGLVAALALLGLG